MAAYAGHQVPRVRRPHRRSSGDAWHRRLAHCSCGPSVQIPHEVPPHIYALTDKMYHDMVSENENQCVIIRSVIRLRRARCAPLVQTFATLIASLQLACGVARALGTTGPARLPAVKVARERLCPPSTS